MSPDTAWLMPLWLVLVEQAVCTAKNFTTIEDEH